MVKTTVIGRWKTLSLTLLALTTCLIALYSIRQHVISWPWPTSLLEHPLHNNGSSVIDLKRTLSPEDHLFRKTMTHYHYWNVTSGTRALDGYRKQVFLINDEVPGPTIEARSGDTLIVEVVNSLPDDQGLSIHWHGMHMREANEMDGAVGFTQCAIPPGSNFTYEFRIDDDQAGTFWYHSHSQEQTGDGLYGGLVVHRPTEIVQEKVEYGYDEEVLLMIGDWGHKTVPERLKDYLFHLSDGREPVPDNLLINGVGTFDCSEADETYGIPCANLEEVPQPQLWIERHKAYRFRIVNVSSLAGITVTMPGFEIKVIQVDGGNQIDNAEHGDSVGILYPGERVDIIVKGMDPLDKLNSSLIVALDRENFAYPNLALTSTQNFPVVLTPSQSDRIDPRSTDGSTKEPVPFDLSKARGSPVPAGTYPREVKQTFVIYTDMSLDALNHEIPAGLINHTIWKMQSDPEAPLLSLDREHWDENQFVPWIQPKKNTWVDVVVNNLDQQGHPFHLHGHDFYVLSSCQHSYNRGSYSPFIDPAPPCGPYNLVNPLKKDTVYVPSRGHVVLRFNADREGIWMFHCHILWHQAAGMIMAFQVKGNEHGVFGDDPQRKETARQFCDRGR